ncbi:MAG: anhydro-N-acetylmuramic acid kinase [Pseudomonadota bacterium]|nr:anhydro-N-acetylmuramic acid kinase [Pseudomonadota bacterium]
MNSSLYIGLMSGTSIDGVDCALVDCAGSSPYVVDYVAADIDPVLKQRLLRLTTNRIDDLRDLGNADIEVARLFAATANTLLEKHGLAASDIVAIGSHGQTIWHEPPQSAARHPFTMQIGDPNTIAELTGITVVADFRRKDMAAGGQGAPLVPALHRELFSDAQTDRIVLNLGGIANITHLPRSGSGCLGLDTGPASVLLDAWIQRHRGEDYDDAGAWAASGTCNAQLLDALLDEPYFRLPAPKSTGREFLNIAWLDRKLAQTGDVQPADVQATLMEFTVQTIRAEIARLGNDGDKEGEKEGEVIVCGGGARNTALLRRLQDVLPGFRILTSTDLGIHADCVEAAAFAWLAKKTLNRETVDFSPFTGARHAVIAGGIYYCE